MEDLSAWAATKGETGHQHEEKEAKIDDEDVNNNLAGFTMHDLDLAVRHATPAIVHYEPTVPRTMSRSRKTLSRALMTIVQALVP